LTTAPKAAIIFMKGMGTRGHRAVKAKRRQPRAPRRLRPGGAVVVLAVIILCIYGIWLGLSGCCCLIGEDTKKPEKKTEKLTREELLRWQIVQLNSGISQLTEERDGIDGRLKEYRKYEEFRKEEDEYTGAKKYYEK
jgi:hypothetical protein